MVGTFEESEGEALHEKLLRAIEAGKEAGGCNQPDRAAALLVVGIEEKLRLFQRPILDLRVDLSDEPTKELRRMYECYKEFISERRQTQ